MKNKILTSFVISCLFTALLMFGCGASREEIEARAKFSVDSAIAVKNAIEAEQPSEENTVTDSNHKASLFNFVARNYSDNYHIDVYIINEHDTILVFVNKDNNSISALKLKH